MDLSPSPPIPSPPTDSNPLAQLLAPVFSTDTRSYEGELLGYSLRSFDNHVVVCKTLSLASCVIIKFAIYTYVDQGCAKSILVELLMQCQLNCWRYMTVHLRVVSVFSACARNLTRMRTRGDRHYSTRSGGCYRSDARIMNHGASEITKELHLAP